MRLYQSIESKNFSSIMGMLHVLVHVLRDSPECRMLWSDERISRQISPCRFQLIRSSELAGSIDESWHLVLYSMASSIELLPTNESIATKGPRVYNFSGIRIAKCRRNRVVDLVVDGTNGKERYFSLLRCFILRDCPRKTWRPRQWKMERSEDIGGKKEIAK